VKPKKATGWACSSCKKLYSYDKHGKLFAEACCACRECGGSPTLYMGAPGQICRPCAAKKELVSAEENLKQAEERLARARTNKTGVM